MRRIKSIWLGLLPSIVTIVAVSLPASAQQQQQKRPNVIVVFGDDVGWRDLGPYGGGESRGAPTPNLDRIGPRVFAS